MNDNILDLSVEYKKTKRLVEKLPIKRLASLKKEIAKYEENVNRCDIMSTNVLADSIGADIDYLRFSDIKLSTEQNKELEVLENLFTGYMNNLSRCRCVKKITK